MTKSTHLSFVLAGLLAAAGVQAQSAPAAGSSNLPPKAGEASTQTMGVPNAQTTNSTASTPSEAPLQSADTARPDTQSMGNAAVTSSIPPKAGEASTFVQGRPNANLNAMPRALSREEVVAELMGRRALFEAHRQSMLQ